VILVTESVPKHVELYQNIDPLTFDLAAFYRQFNGKPGARFFYLHCKDAREYLKKVKKSIAVIEAAGGVVKNPKGEYLFIYRNDKWDLPKGKLEKGEKKWEGAIREVEEECAITISSLGEKICKTYHTYTVRGEVVLKRTHWYKMNYKGIEKPKPQREEGITDIRWFRKGHINAILKNTFPSIMDVLAKMDMIKDKPAPLSE